MYLDYSSAEQTATELAAASGAERRWLLCLADRHGEDLPALLATHPADAARIARLQEAARGWDATGQPLVALPPL